MTRSLQSRPLSPLLNAECGMRNGESKTRAEGTE